MRWVAIVPFVVVACSHPGEDARAAFLRSTIVDDNRVTLAREPDLVAQKLAKMATRRFDFFRGTAPQYWRDIVAPGPMATPTAFGDGPSSVVWVVGDPHPENLGTFRATDGTVYLDWNDFDGAGWAPWWLDLRRLAAAFRVAGDDMKLDDVARDDLARAVVTGYAAEIERLAAGGGREPIRDGAIVLDLIEHATEDGDQRTKLDAYTHVDVDGQRKMIYGDLLPRRPDGVVEDTIALPTPAEERMARAAVERWRETTIIPVAPDATVVKAVGRRLGAGVASFSVYRFYALLEGPTPNVDDDWLLEIKETTSGLRIPSMPRISGDVATTNGRRVVLAQRILGLRADGDDLLGWADLEPLSFRVRNRTGYQKGVDLIDLADPKVTLDDKRVFATQAGSLLARAHAFAPTAGGTRGLDVIAPRIAGRAAELADETAAFAAAYDALVASDFELFGALLVEHGPLLGAVP